MTRRMHGGCCGPLGLDEQLSRRLAAQRPRKFEQRCFAFGAFDKLDPYDGFGGA